MWVTFFFFSFHTKHDGIHGIVESICDLELVLVLCKIYNKCFPVFCLPDCWKSSSIIPVFKNSGKPSDPSNYRLYKFSTSLCPSSKRSNQHWIGYLISHSVQDKHYVFLFFNSIAYMLIIITEFFYSVVALDIWKVLVKVTFFTSFRFLWSNIRLNPIFFKRSFMNVVLNGHGSRSFHINAGDSKSSLDLRFFLFFINYLFDVVSFQLRIYAGDKII